MKALGITTLILLSCFVAISGTFSVVHGNIEYENRLVIQSMASNDLELNFSTFIGGSYDDRSLSVAVDSECNIYLGGYTASSDFTTLSAYDDTVNGTDGFIAKFTFDGNLIYSTLIGGTSTDKIYSIKVDNDQNVYAFGITYSDDFPTVNAYDTSLGGSYDCFVTKLNATGNGLVYSTYLGGSSGDSPGDIAIDQDGSVYLVGVTSSSNYPTVSAFDSSYEGYSDGFITKLSAAGSSIVYSSFIGGSGNDDAGAIAVDSDGKAFITGSSRSSDFPTKDAYSTAFSDSRFCCYIMKLTTGGAIDFSTHVGGTDAEFPDGDIGNDISIDMYGNVYVTGQTSSESFPLVNAFTSSLAANYDGFVLKMNYSGNALIYSSYINGDYSTTGLGIYSTPQGEVCLAGSTSSDSMLIIDGNATFGGGMDDGYFFRIHPNGTPFYSTYFGGSDSDMAGEILVDPEERIVLEGISRSEDLPMQDAFDDSFNGGSFDGFLAVFSEVPTITDSTTTTVTTTTEPPTTTAPPGETNYPVPGQGITDPDRLFGIPIENLAFLILIIGLLSIVGIFVFRE